MAAPSVNGRNVLSRADTRDSMDAQIEDRNAMVRELLAAGAVAPTLAANARLAHPQVRLVAVLGVLD